MAGRGPAPSAPGSRRRRNTPARGEWTDLQPLAAPVLPPAHKEWPHGIASLWNAWRMDPVSQTWGPADIQFLIVTAAQWDDLAPNEQRLRMDGLGLTPKGRRDLRLRLPTEQEQESGPEATVTPLKIVRKDVA